MVPFPEVTNLRPPSAGARLPGGRDLAPGDSRPLGF